MNGHKWIHDLAVDRHAKVDRPNRIEDVVVERRVGVANRSHHKAIFHVGGYGVTPQLGITGRRTIVEGKLDRDRSFKWIAKEICNVCLKRQAGWHLFGRSVSTPRSQGQHHC